MRPFLLATLLCLCALFTSRDGIAAGMGDATLCQQATASAERISGVPDQLLDAISRVESGRYDQIQGAVRAWTWTINAEGRGHFYSSNGEAVEAARQFRARGIQSIDVGCTQINLMYHPAAFASLDEAFDPAHNTAYAAHFLTQLFQQAGSWPHAAAAYHSQTPELGTDYQRKVLEAWSDPIVGHNNAGRPDPSSPTHMAEFHRQLADLSASGQGGMPERLSATGSPAGSSSPIGHGSRNAPLGGFGRILRSGSLFAGNGRNLSAYRAMPVAMVTGPPPPTRY